MEMLPEDVKMRGCLVPKVHVLQMGMRSGHYIHLGEHYVPSWPLLQDLLCLLGLGPEQVCV